MTTANTGTIAGYHYALAWLTCQRKFFFEHVENLDPTSESRFLLRGRALHSAHEVYFKNAFAADQLVPTFLEELRFEDYADKQQWAGDKDWGVKLLALWLKNWHEENQKRYTVLDVELELFATLPNGKLFTGRIDRLLHDKFLSCNLIQDTKTTSFSVGRKFQSCDDEDQAASNMILLDANKPDLNVRTFMPDILYNRNSVYDCARPGVIYRSDADITDCAIALARTFDEIDAAVAAYDPARPLSFSFKRAPEACGLYSGCPFRTVCRSYVAGTVPIGFKKKENQDDSE